jgi:hypothetical protein
MVRARRLVMNSVYRTFVVGLLAISCAQNLAAQTALDPSGHWEGSITIPSGQKFRVEFDLGRNSDGTLRGTFNQPDQILKGIPVSSVAIDGVVVTIELRLNGRGVFEGNLAADGSSISGVFASQLGPAPFRLTRTGDARFDAPPRNPAIGKDLEGTWTGRLDVDAGYRLVLTMLNQPDGSSSGVMTSLDEGGLAIPVVIKHEGTRLALELPMIGGAFSGDVNPSASEVAGTYTTPRGLALPLTLKKTGR